MKARQSKRAAKAPPRATPRPPERTAAGWRVRIDGWSPATLNSLINARHYMVAHRLKRADKAVITLAFRGVPPATAPRRVRLLVILGPRMRGPDPDAFQKSLGDALTHARMLTDDNRQGVEWAPVVYERGPAKGCVIELEDMGGET